jgi:undecaprenyl-diphosphatase
MSIFDALFLGLLQGITEFLPISSSGHLVLVESWLKLDVETMKSFDIAVHFGTLLAILIYFRKDFLFLIKSVIHRFWPSFFATRGALGEADKIAMKSGSKTAGYIVLATVPAVLVGLFFGDYLDANFRNAFSVAIAMILMGVIFFAAEFAAARIAKTEYTLKNTVLIGIAQACALIPGVSRSGATIAAGLAQGITREAAARFSFLLGSVAIAAASVLALYHALKGETPLPSFDLMTAGIVTSFISGYAAIAFLMRFLKKHTLHVFGVYRVVLGFVILTLLVLH